MKSYAAMTPEKMLRRQRAKRSQQLGEYAQRLAVAELLRQGALRAEELATPIRMIRGRPVRTKKVLGDIIGWWPGGRFLLCEVKAHDDHSRPVRSDFQQHQLDNLRDCAKAGGTAIVAWLSKGGIIIEDARGWYAPD